MSCNQQHSFAACPCYCIPNKQAREVYSLLLVLANAIKRSFSILKGDVIQDEKERVLATRFETTNTVIVQKNLCIA